MADQPLLDRLDEIIDALVARRDATAALRDPELAPLARIAADLRHYPRREFTSRLREQLQRRTPMTTTLLPANVRAGFATVTPYLRAPDSGLADFLVRAFDAVETRASGDHGVHRELRLGNSMVIIDETGNRPEAPSRRAAFHLFVEDVDATFAQAIAAGGTSIGDVQDQPYGERSGFIRDAYGNHWYIATPLGPQSVGHALSSVTPFLHAQPLDAYMTFLARAFGATEDMRHEEPAGVVRYARMRVGDAALEFGPAEAMPGAFFLYAEDPDAVYEQAVAAGAKSVSAPAGQPSADRVAVVEDPVGNHWYIARPA